MSDPTTTRTRDRWRAVALAASMTLQFAAGIVGGIGVMAESVGTVANSYPNPLLPAGAAFGIWTLIYLVTLVTAIRALFPSQLGRAVQRALGWKLAAAGVLNAAWIGCFGNRWIVAAQVVIIVLLVVLALGYRAVDAHPAAGVVDRLTVHLPVACYTGWVSAATVVGLVTTLTASGVTVTATAAVVVLAVATVAIAVAAWRVNAKVGYAGAVVWALAWILAEATGGVAVATGVCLVVVVAAALGSTWRRRDRVAALLG